MKIESAEWTKTVNILKIRCDCGKLLKHRSDRWKVYCSHCDKVANLQTLRDDYAKANAQGTKQ